MSGHTHRLILNLHPLKVSARFGVTSVVVVSLSILTLGQSAARPDRGIRPIGSYAVSDIENISLTNGNVNLSIPLAGLPPVAGGKLSWTLRAIYNSKLWDVVGTEVAPSPPLGGHTLNEVQLSDTGGWSGGGGKYVISLHNVGEDFEGILPGDPSDPETTLLRQYRWKMVLTTPDGAKHELRPVDFPSYPGSRDWARGYFKDTPRTDSVNATMRYYSFDGSYLWAKIDAFDGFPTSWTVYLPDGTKIRQRPGGLQRITDTNGNSIKIFTDTDATGNITTTHFQDEQTGREIRAIGTSSLTGPPSSQIKYQTVGGQEVTIDLTFGLTHIQGRTYPNGDPCGSEVIIDYEYFALRSIVLPQTEAGAARQQFSFSYNSDITDTVNIPEQQTQCGVVRPAITQASRGLGSLSQVVTPNGAVINYKYTRDRDGAAGGLILDAKDVARESITRKTLTHDGITDIWTYDVSFAGGTVTGPDGSVSTETFHSHDTGVASHLGGEKAGLVYRSDRSGKEIVERHWTLLGFSGGDNSAPGGFIGFNQVVDAEYTTLVGNPNKMRASEFQYDFNGNRIQQTDYDWFSPSSVSRDAQGVPIAVPAGTAVLRTITTNYYNPATGAGSGNVYAKRVTATAEPLILNAVQETAAGPSRSQFSYDGEVQGIRSRGNLTKESRWDGAKFVNITHTYDLTNGNRTSTTDPRGNVTQFFYDAAKALPSSVVVDPLNGTGQQTTSITYDFSTGLVTSQTDPNGRTTISDYTNQLLGAVDPYGRPGRVTTPDGRQAVTRYFDNGRQVEVWSDLRSPGDGLLRSRTSADQLGRGVLSETSENGSTYSISSQTQYQQMGRITITTNPTRNQGDPADGWSRTTRDEIGRVVEVAALSGSPPGGTSTGVVSTSYNANQVTVADQASKARRSATDGLGRLVKVTEDPAGLAFDTFYSYDTLGNLTGVTQGGQTRSFAYDALSRLTGATNPESGSMTYGYDDSGNLVQKRDARG